MNILKKIKNCKQLDCVQCKFNKMCDFRKPNKRSVKGDKL